MRSPRPSRQYGFVSIVCGEGITNADGTPVSASQTKDNFHNVEFGAMGGTSAAMMLHRIISDRFGWRGEFQVTESLQMCAADRAVKLDIDEAYGCGREAVRLAEQGVAGVMVTIERASQTRRSVSQPVRDDSAERRGERGPPDAGQVHPPRRDVRDQGVPGLRAAAGRRVADVRRFDDQACQTVTRLRAAIQSEISNPNTEFQALSPTVPRLAGRAASTKRQSGRLVLRTQRYHASGRVPLAPPVHWRSQWHTNRRHIQRCSIISCDLRS